MEEVEIQQYIVALEELRPMPAATTLRDDLSELIVMQTSCMIARSRERQKGDLIAALWKL